MARHLVTGIAGFIGSHLAEKLLALGHEVVGIDSFSDYYAREIKEANLGQVKAHGPIAFHELDLSSGIDGSLLEGVDTVFHLAGQPGVRGSFGAGFDAYLDRNVRATQRVVEAVVKGGVRRLVFASSSSVYGDQERYPVREDAPKRPRSPYGVTKLACESLIDAYAQNDGLDAVSLRYFTVFGPRQRPDMALSRFLVAVERGEEIALFGGGRMRRDFTYVSDAVDATVAASSAVGAGGAYNVGGGNQATNADLLAHVEALLGKRARIVLADRPRGDARETAADITRARVDLGFAPKVSLQDGIARQAAARTPA